MDTDGASRTTRKRMLRRLPPAAQRIPRVICAPYGPRSDESRSWVSLSESIDPASAESERVTAAWVDGRDSLRPQSRDWSQDTPVPRSDSALRESCPSTQARETDRDTEAGAGSIDSLKLTHHSRAAGVPADR